MASDDRAAAFVKLHHVQVSCPPAGELASRRFYRDGLGMIEVVKPAALAGRGGAWFWSAEADGAVPAEAHVGEAEFNPPARRIRPWL